MVSYLASLLAHEQEVSSLCYGLPRPGCPFFSFFHLTLLLSTLRLNLLNERSDRGLALAGLLPPTLNTSGEQSFTLT